MDINLKPINQTIKSFLIQKHKKKHRMTHYNSLINVLVSTGLVSFNGKVYRSVADLTIDFFTATKTRI